MLIHDNKCEIKALQICSAMLRGLGEWEGARKIRRHFESDEDHAMFMNRLHQWQIAKFFGTTSFFTKP